MRIRATGEAPSGVPARQDRAEPTTTTGRPPGRRRAVVAHRSRPVMHVLAFVRKEVLAVLRQPRLLAVLVVGPFLLLFLFGLGYDQEETVLRTAFVGPEDSEFEAVIGRFEGDLDQYVDAVLYTPDIITAERLLDAGDVDLLVLFPADPAETVLAGEQAVIDVLHEKLDPIQQTAVNVAAQVAVQELNAIVIEQVVDQVQERVEPYRDTAERSTVLLDELEVAAARADRDETARLAAEADRRAGELRSLIDLTESMRATLGDELPAEDRDRLARLSAALADYRAATSALAASDGDLTPADVRAARTSLTGVLDESERIITLDPAVAVRPFRTDTENLLRRSVSLNDFFAPSAIALLVQHMALTFASLGLVRDRRLGLFELFRVGPIGSGRILLGKYLANLALAGAVAGSLVVAVNQVIDVPQRGSWWWIAAGIAGLVTASIAAGLLLSLLAESDSQAVQYAMLALLAGLFFGGFLLELDAIRYPVKVISHTLPVTYGTQLLRDVMLRGAPADPADLIGLAATSVAYGGLAWLLLARKLRLGTS